MEDTEKLINAVNSYPPLWDMRDKKYHSREIQRILWRKVSEQIGIDVANLKKKWKGPRDTFRKEHKKLLKSGQEAPDEFISTWPYFEQMLFLSDVVHPRELKGNLSSSVSNTGGVDDSQNVEMNEAVKEQSSASNDKENSSATLLNEPMIMDSPPTTPSNQNRKKVSNENKGAANIKTAFKKSRKTDNVDVKFLEIERQKFKLFSETTSMKGDSDYHFLLSLLPYLKKVTEPRKLFVRHRLQQVLIDEENYNALQHEEPSMSYASRCESDHPSTGDFTWTSAPTLGGDAATQYSWTSQDQTDA